jgi:hypothetical protein
LDWLEFIDPKHSTKKKADRAICTGGSPVTDDSHGIEGHCVGLELVGGTGGDHGSAHLDLIRSEGQRPAGYLIQAGQLNRSCHCSFFGLKPPQGFRASPRGSIGRRSQFSSGCMHAGNIDPDHDGAEKNNEANCDHGQHRTSALPLSRGRS